MQHLGNPANTTYDLMKTKIIFNENKIRKKYEKVKIITGNKWDEVYIENFKKFINNESFIRVFVLIEFNQIFGNNEKW